MNGGKHKDCENNIQALRRKGEGGPLLTNVMDEGMTHRVVIVGMALHKENNVHQHISVFTNMVALIYIILIAAVHYFQFSIIA